MLFNKNITKPLILATVQCEWIIIDCTYSSKLDCKEQNGYTNIKPDIGAGGPAVPGWGGAAPVRPSVCTPDMTRYTPSSVDQVARDRAWMNTCSSLSAAAQELPTSDSTTFSVLVKMI